MKRRNKFSFVPNVLGFQGILGLGILAALVAPVQADSTEVYTQTWSDLGSSSSVALTFNKFDASLGSLDSVTIGGDITITGELDILNLVSSPELFTNGFLEEPVSVSGPFTETINQVAAVTNISGMANAGPFVFSDFPGCTNTAALNQASITANELPTFELLPNSRTFTVIINVGTGSATEGATFPNAPADVSLYGFTFPAMSSSGSATLSGDVSITYTYSNGPQPGFGLGQGAGPRALHRPRPGAGYRSRGYHRWCPRRRGHASSPSPRQTNLRIHAPFLPAPSA